ncbi:hypothetical protein EDB81DRAFT_881318 [Dactylonectria macrodidyma]|uniref:Uncharacterized protein n=1 Tax=Dactylonectria macrodidyma TaxID=307937 RepID=A0A9P9JDZ7_9HYPO|nr:hypothetical protein EDB81DRAFT_881318 [Dactylonectria macrodidyma]
MRNAGARLQNAYSTVAVAAAAAAAAAVLDYSLPYTPVGRGFGGIGGHLLFDGFLHLLSLGAMSWTLAKGTQRNGLE